jgi:hypothetical protein
MSPSCRLAVPEHGGTRRDQVFANSYRKAGVRRNSVARQVAVTGHYRGVLRSAWHRRLRRRRARRDLCDRRILYAAVMNVLIGGAGSFAVALLVHLVWWRIRVPCRQWRALILVFGVVAAAGAAVLAGGGAARLGLSAPRLVLTAFVFGGLALSYAILFSAIEADSPTLTMIGLVRRHGRSGIDEGKLRRMMTERSFVRARLDRMLQDGLAVEEGGRLQATRGGLRFTSVILSYRRLIGRRLGVASCCDR